ncbi:MAG: 16S rRNA (uracil(1498)-N(3))-methyltransferase [Candidatus Omnitrophota bacterium]
MSRFFVPKGSVSAGRITVTGEELHHARDVMRLREGDLITVFDGTGKEYTGTVDKIGRDEISAAVSRVSEVPKERCAITLIQAIPKSSKMDLIIEKATELGVARIIPIVTSRTVVKISGEGNKTERWKKIAVVAAKQCGRSTFPEIAPVTGLKDSLVEAKGCEISLMPCLYEGNKRLMDAIGGRKAASAAVFIGPEGDFTKEEVEAAVSSGATPVILGNEVLRSETAAVAVLSIMSYELRW